MRYIDDMNKTYKYTGSTIGTKNYMSPEMHYHREYNYNTDIFSLGVLIFNLFTYFKHK